MSAKPTPVVGEQQSAPVEMFSRITPRFYCEDLHVYERVRTDPEEARLVIVVSPQQSAELAAAELNKAFAAGEEASRQNMRRALGLGWMAR